MHTNGQPGVSADAQPQTRSATGASHAPERRTFDRTSLRDLILIAAEALEVSPLTLARSIFGPVRDWLPPHHRYSELRLLDPWRLRRALGYVANATLPSIPRTPPAGGPPWLHNLFFQPTVILQRPDHYGDYTSFPDEKWFFINGVLTNSAVAQLNAAMIAQLFQRPLTIIQNSTDALLVDLLQCAIGKEWRRATEPALKAYPAVHAALRDPHKKRVVLIAHSQGTIIAANVLRLLYSDVQPGMPRAFKAAAAAPYAPPEFIYPYEGEFRPGDLPELTVADLAKLELYAFATCASHMTAYDHGPDGRPIPWLEHFGNEHDVVARLGMLAPRFGSDAINIDGARYMAGGAYGHLLNAHYLAPIERFQRVRLQPRGRGGSCPFRALEVAAGEARAPRLFNYINGGVPPDE